MLCVGWERNLSGSEASYTNGSSYVSKLFFLPFIIKFVKMGSCRELCSLNSGIFPLESLNGPDRFQPCCSWVDPSFTFSGVVGGSLFRLLHLASLLYLVKENKWILGNWTAIPFLLKLPLMAKICGCIVCSVCIYNNVWFTCLKG